MKNFRRFCLLLMICLMLMGCMMPAAAAEDSSVEKGCSTLDAKLPLKSDEQLLETAKSVILYELESKTLVYAWNADEQIDPSGMNKIMTALLALERGTPDDMVTVTRKALDTVQIGSVSAGLKAKEEISLRDLLYCMMVGSANDAAAVVAEHIGGSQEAFVALMNQRAKELGCSNTCFLNPTGLSQEGQYSTARDLAKITEQALKDELFTEMFSAVEYTVAATNSSEERKILTTNYLISRETIRTQFDERVTGGKTGALSTTDRSLIATAELEGIRYLSVVMSAQGTVSENGLSVLKFGSFEETRALLDNGFEGYTKRGLFVKGQAMDQFAVDGDMAVVAAGPAVAVSAMLPVDATEAEVTYRTNGIQNISAPVKQGQKVGTMEVWFRSMCVAQCDLIALHRVVDPETVIEPLDPELEVQQKFPWKTVWLIAGIVLVGAALLAVVALASVRMFAVVRQNIRRKNRRNNHKKER